MPCLVPISSTRSLFRRVGRTNLRSLGSSARRAQGLAVFRRLSTGSSRWNRAGPPIGLVLLDLPRDLVSVRPHVSPHVSQILGPERGINAEQVSFGSPQSARLFQYPRWDARAHNARLPAAHARTALDPRERVAHCSTCAFSARLN